MRIVLEENPEVSHSESHVSNRVKRPVRWFERYARTPTLTVVSALSVIACSSSSSSPLQAGITSRPNATENGTPASTKASPPTEGLSPTTEAPGCDGTATRPGSEAPSWAVGGAPALRFVESAEGNVVGFLFADPLRSAPRSDAQNNKILWVVKDPRDGKSLRVTGRNGTGQFSAVKDANSFPGQIYPMTVDAPSPGCWHLTLDWSQHTATVNLLYLP